MPEFIVLLFLYFIALNYSAIFDTRAEGSEAIGMHAEGVHQKLLYS